MRSDSKSERENISLSVSAAPTNNGAHFNFVQLVCLHYYVCVESNYSHYADGGNKLRLSPAAHSSQNCRFLINLFKNKNYYAFVGIQGCVNAVFLFLSLSKHMA
jgi:hypothetical protein